MLSSFAIFSISISIPNTACGPPKPLKAPLGTVFVAKAFATIFAFGI